MLLVPPAIAALSHAFYVRQKRTADAAATVAQDAWRGLPTGAPPDVQWSWWAANIGVVSDAIMRAQHTNAARGSEYVALASAMQGLEGGPKVDPLAFVSDTDLVMSELDKGMTAYAYRRAAGVPEHYARYSGASRLIRTARTMAQDSGREAVGVGIAASPSLGGYYRFGVGENCERCAVLFGKWYAWDADFDRHPQCDCGAAPAADPVEGVYYDVTRAVEDGMVSGISKARARAILDGADPSQVINSREGMGKAMIYGREVERTTYGTTRRGLAGRRLAADGFQKSGGRYSRATAPRLTPGEIYRLAEDKAHARRLLYKYAYLINPV